MAINLDDIMDIEKDVEDQENEITNDTNTGIEQIKQNLEEMKTAEVDLTEKLSDNVDKEEFKKIQNSLAKKEVEVQLDPQTRLQVDKIKKAMDLTKATNISMFGSKSQENISNYSRSILEKTKAKDSGEVGQKLTELMVTVKGTDIKMESEKGFFDKIFGKAKNQVEIITAKQESIETQLDIISSQLMEARFGLLKDVDMLDKLYEENLQYYDNLNMYIIAGKEMIKEETEQRIPNMLIQVEQMENQDEKSRAVQAIRDYQSNVNRFEKRIHDLEISKVISIQMMPQLKMIQDNDLQLADKVQDAVNNTIPLWRTQFVMALTLQRQAEVAKLSKSISDATDEFIVRNSQMLYDNTIEVKKEAERSIVSIEALEKSQELLIKTIEETIQIEEDAKQQRKEAEVRMVGMQQELAHALTQSIQKRDQNNKLTHSTQTKTNLDLISGAI